MKTKLFFTLVLAGLFSVNSKAQCTASTPPTQVFSMGVFTVAPNTSMVVRQICSNTIVYDTIGGGTQKDYYLLNGASLYLKNAATVRVYMQGNSYLTVIQATAAVMVYKESTATTSGSFSPAVTTCSAVSFPTISCTSGIIENYGSNSISVFPNPASDHLTVINDFSTTLKCNITNLVGQKIKSFSVENGNKIIDTSSLSAGVYYFTAFENSKMVYSKKIVITN